MLQSIGAPLLYCANKLSERLKSKIIIHEVGKNEVAVMFHVLCALSKHYYVSCTACCCCLLLQKSIDTYIDEAAADPDLWYYTQDTDDFAKTADDTNNQVRCAGCRVWIALGCTVQCILVFIFGAMGCCII